MYKTRSWGMTVLFFQRSIKQLVFHYYQIIWTIVILLQFFLCDVQLILLFFLISFYDEKGYKQHLSCAMHRGSYVILRPTRFINNIYHARDAWIKNIILIQEFNRVYVFNNSLITLKTWKSKVVFWNFKSINLIACW